MEWVRGVNAMSQDPKPREVQVPLSLARCTLTQLPCISRSLPSELLVHPGHCGDKATGKQGHRRPGEGSLLADPRPIRWAEKKGLR